MKHIKLWKLEEITTRTSTEQYVNQFKDSKCTLQRHCRVTDRAGEEPIGRRPSLRPQTYL